jgi:anti-sigma regulatory factor (Ser/Thr protein kinase)
MSETRPARRWRGQWRELDIWDLPSVPGNEREVLRRVTEAVRPLGLPEWRLENLQTAVAEATMNAMEHGNSYDPKKPVTISVLARATGVLVRIRDAGGGQDFPRAEEPNLTAKLAGKQTPRGWGIFLMEHLVDDMRSTSDETSHTNELFMRLPRRRATSTKTSAKQVAQMTTQMVSRDRH